MQPFNADSKCPKCGGLALFVCYHDQACACKDTDGEHLQRACGCGFRWPEACMDAGPTVMEQLTQATLLERAWGIIANAGGGDWTKESKDWQEAAAKWRDAYHQGGYPIALMGGTSVVDEAVEDARRWRDHECCSMDNGSFICSRVFGHSKDHVAVDASGKVVARWPQVVDEAVEDAVRSLGGDKRAWCPSTHESLFCTRVKGHEGDHVAAYGKKILARWPQVVAHEDDGDCGKAVDTSKWKCTSCGNELEFPVPALLDGTVMRRICEKCGAKFECSCTIAWVDNPAHKVDKVEHHSPEEWATWGKANGIDNETLANLVALDMQSRCVEAVEEAIEMNKISGGRIAELRYVLDAIKRLKP